MKNDVKLPNFTLCRTCEDMLVIKLHENSRTSESKCQMGCENRDEVFKRTQTLFTGDVFTDVVVAAA